MLKNIFQFFGSKSVKEIKGLLPIVAHINARSAALAALPADALREESQQLRAKIAHAISPITEKIRALKEQATNTGMELGKREALFTKIENLRATRNQTLEEALQAQLVPAFALMKETARRFASAKKILVKANDMDKALAARASYVSVTDETACWTNEWEAAGGKVTWDMTHYDVQLIGGIILHQGKVAEMATGEGKTLVATLPAFLNGLSGLGVHIVTVNDYLARRDAAWNGPLFEFHGLRVDCIDVHEAHSPERAQSYQADIIYGTNNEFGFDYLRDNMARDLDGLVQRGHHFAMVDEVDSVLIDEARTPLIISGPVKNSNEKLFYTLKPVVKRLVELQQALCTKYLNEAKKELAVNNTKVGGLSLFRAHRGLPKYTPLIRYLSEKGVKHIMQQTEGTYLQDNQRLMPEADAPLYFTIDEKNHSIELTEKGLDLISQTSEEKNLFIMPDVGSSLAQIENNTALSQKEQLQEKATLMKAYTEKSARIHTLNQLLKAYTLYEKDKDYVVMGGKINIVDEQTGRMLSGRRYSDGLHQAIEAREQVKVEESTQTYATVTLQNYFRMYHKLSGMTGTAETEATELWNIYKLDVTVVPTHKTITRKDDNDKVYKTTREKFQAIINNIKKLQDAKRPTLVGTTSVEASELLSRLLKTQHIPHQVLNAKQHQREAEIIRQAGNPGAVTIATNMAGRGTDIKLHPEALQAGGLAIIGSERHEARRVDRQLRGRAGRQGDPGGSQFFVSLEDNLMRLFGSGRIAKWMDRMGLAEGEVIEHSMITRSIERAQKKIEENNFGIRKRLLEYDNVMNAQREVIYERRRHALFGEQLQVDLGHMCMDTCQVIAEEAVVSSTWTALQLSLLEAFGSGLQLQEEACDLKDSKQLCKQLYTAVQASYEARKQSIRENVLPVLRHTHEEHQGKIEQIMVPVHADKKRIHVVVNVSACIASDGHLLIKEMEKAICLKTIDSIWKEHLREMDDLKQAVQNVVYEQKDPLIVYKFESFQLFKQLLTRLNGETIGFLMRAEVPQLNEVTTPTPRAHVKQPRLQESKAELHNTGTSQAAGNLSQHVPAQPVHAQKIAGRNDKVTVQYTDGRIEKEVKYKKIAEDVKKNRCVIVETHH